MIDLYKQIIPELVPTLGEAESKTHPRRRVEAC